MGHRGGFAPHLVAAQRVTVEEKGDLSHRTHDKGPLPGDGWRWWDPNGSFPNVPVVPGSREKQERICTKTKQIS